MPTRLFALSRFHVAGGARVASRNAIATIGLIMIVLGQAPDPGAWLRFLTLGAASRNGGSGPLVGLMVIALALAPDAVPRLTLGLGGWTRSLPADAVAHRRALVLGLPIVQLPLAAAVALAALLTVVVYHAPLSPPKLLGTLVGLVAAGAAAVPARRWLVSGPCFAASALLAGLGRWLPLLASVGLFVIGDMSAGALRFRATPGAGTPRAAGALRMYRLTWRALGWRLAAPLPVATLALAAAWFYTRNNALAPADVAFVARLWSVIAIALTAGAIADMIVTRRPSWPWIRSLPWSSTDRAVDDAIAIGAPALVVALATALVHPRTVIVALMMLPPLSALAVLLLQGARRRLTRVSGALVLAGPALGVLVAYEPWAAALVLAATPLLVRAAARRDRAAIVTGWKELHHDAAGDSLAWSGQ